MKYPVEVSQESIMRLNAAIDMLPHGLAKQFLTTASPFLAEINQQIAALQGKKDDDWQLVDGL